MSSRPVEITPDEIEKRLQNYIEWIGKSGIMLERFTDEKIAALGRVVIPMLSSGFTGEGAAAIFVLAYHLKAPGSRFRAFMFNSDESLQVTTDERYSDHWDKTNATSVIAAIGDPTREAAVYSYVAATLFRLFTKPASYYVNTWSHMKATKGLKTFLYDSALKNTGLHIISLMEQLSDVLNCSVGSIMITMEHGTSQVEVYILAEALRSESPEKHSGIMQITQFAEIGENHKRKYGKLAQRLFTHLKSQNPPRI
ncbi:hypothetical protein L2E82_04931 [Cichorium intybus]|uniref:Uncharacterized protein n=1 Tax=Cichorium intybus TaxID=13427 RepID=A0ACB9H648_CICIN|nr:hypothetical protein L2E82_04931 [Cichorium intybus]